VFELLRRAPELRSLPGEGHLLPELFHPAMRLADHGHALGRDDLRSKERKALWWAVGHLSKGYRYLDKTPRNSLRIPYLAAAFPGAWFVFVARDGRAAVSSLVTGWRSRSDMFPGIRMPGLSIEGYEGDRWRFVIPPGWRAYVRGRSLAEVCAFQWRACAEAILDARDGIEGERWIEVRYEDLLVRPGHEVGRLLAALGLSQSPLVLDPAGTLDRHVAKAVTPPRPGKWRQENLGEVERVLPLIAPTMERLGYAIEDTL
jgi:hypothetical protein